MNEILNLKKFLLFELFYFECIEPIVIRTEILNDPYDSFDNYEKLSKNLYNVLEYIYSDLSIVNNILSKNIKYNEFVLKQIKDRHSIIFSKIDIKKSMINQKKFFKWLKNNGEK